MNWISVKEQLPIHKMLVLVCVVAPHPDGRKWRGIITAYFDKHKGWFAPFTGENVEVWFWADCPDFPFEMMNEQEKI